MQRPVPHSQNRRVHQIQTLPPTRAVRGATDPQSRRSRVQRDRGANGLQKTRSSPSDGGVAVTLGNHPPTPLPPATTTVPSANRATDATPIITMTTMTTIITTPTTTTARTIPLPRRTRARAATTALDHALLIPIMIITTTTALALAPAPVHRALIHAPAPAHVLVLDLALAPAPARVPSRALHHLITDVVRVLLPLRKTDAISLVIRIIVEILMPRLARTRGRRRMRIKRARRFSLNSRRMGTSIFLLPRRRCSAGRIFARRM